MSNKIVQIIDEHIDNSTLNQSILITGIKHSGKSQLAHHIAAKLGVPYIDIINKAEDLKNLIAAAYVLDRQVVYVVKDIDDASSIVREALLKLLEEPPPKCYIIITAINKHALPVTILNRVKLFNMPGYDISDLKKCRLDCTNLYYRVMNTPIKIKNTDQKGFDAIVDICLGYDQCVFSNKPYEILVYSSNIQLKKTDKDKMELSMLIEVLINLYMASAIKSPAYSKLVVALNEFTDQLYSNSVSMPMLYHNMSLCLRSIRRSHGIIRIEDKGKR